MTQSLATEVIIVSGFARYPFEALADVFARVVAAQGRGGAALSVRHHGEHVVDLVGGTQAADSLQLLFSVSKVLTAVVAAMAAEAGELDLDAPLADSWPEFAKSSTATITPRMVLSHSSGLAAIDRALTLDELLAHEDDAVIGVQEPYWEPGTAHGYHAFTYGTLMDGLFRRVLGKSVGQVVSERISTPLGLDLWIGTPESERPRIMPIDYSRSAITPRRAAFVSASDIPLGSTARLAGTMDLYNCPAIYGADWPSTSGVGSARALSLFMAATLDGTLLSSAARESMNRTRARGMDRVLGVPTHFGSGVQLPFPQLPFLGPASYGHEAAGGSAAFADCEFGVGVGWTTSIYPPMMGASPGFIALLPTLRHCLTADSSQVEPRGIYG